MTYKKMKGVIIINTFHFYMLIEHRHKRARELLILLKF